MSKMQSASRRLLVAVSLSLLMVVTLLGVALAHEGREVGPYQFVVGWMNEPALVNQPNGLDLRVARAREAHAEEEEHAEGEHAEEEGAEHTDEASDAHAETTPVEGLESTLQAEVIYGDQTMALELRPVFNEPGSYTADIIPTVPGSYIFRLFGEIEGTPIDETFNSADGDFSDIEPLDALLFPSADATASEEPLVASAQEVNSTRLLAIAGLVVGVLGLVVGGLALIRR